MCRWTRTKNRPGANPALAKRRIIGDRLISREESAGMETRLLPITSIDVLARQDQGRVRTRQEDSFLAEALPDRPVAMLVIADGMGGQQGGDVASHAAITAVAAMLRPALAALQPIETLRLPDADDAVPDPAQGSLPAANPLKTINLSPRTIVLDAADTAQPANQPAPMSTTLAQTVQAAQVAVRTAANEIGAIDDAGCTLTLAAVVGRTLHLAHLGDSRAYLWRHSQLRQLTYDHSGAAALVAAGLITAEEARTHPVAHQLYRYLGGNTQAAQPVITQEPLEDGDLLLLCSDGLWGEIDDAQIAGILIGAADLPTVAAALVDAANAAGGEDNITVVLARIGG